MTKPMEFLGLTTDEWQAVGSIATAGAFIIAALAVLVAFLQFRHTRAATEAQLRQDRETAAEQSRQARQTAAEQLRQNREAAEQQLEQSRLAAAEQLAMDRRAMELQRENAMQTALNQSRPYVLLSLEASPISFSFLDLVVENAGAGPALDVRIQVDPPFRRAKETRGNEIAEARIFREPIPLLPPRYRVRTFFDSAIERNGAPSGELPDTHEVTIEYHDGRGNSWRERTVLDMTILDGLMFTEEYGIHHAAKALREIKDVLKKSATLQQSPIAVTVEGRSDHIDRVRAEREQRMRQHEELAERMREQSENKQADESE